MGKIEPKGRVIFFNEEVPVTWERETFRYVFNVKRVKKRDGKWVVHRRNFDDKVDKTEIIDGNFDIRYIPKSKRKEGKEKKDAS